MNIGDVVVPRSNEYVLASGASRYTHAICVSVTPFILVSEDADMLWKYSVEIDNYVALCQAHPDIVACCMTRKKRSDRE